MSEYDIPTSSSAAEPANQGPPDGLNPPLPGDATPERPSNYGFLNLLDPRMEASGAKQKKCPVFTIPHWAYNVFFLFAVVILAHATFGLNFGLSARPDSESLGVQLVHGANQADNVRTVAEISQGSVLSGIAKPGDTVAFKDGNTAMRSEDADLAPKEKLHIDIVSGNGLAKGAEITVPASSVKAGNADLTFSLRALLNLIPIICGVFLLVTSRTKIAPIALGVALIFAACGMPFGVEATADAFPVTFGLHRLAHSLVGPGFIIFAAWAFGSKQVPSHRAVFKKVLATAFLAGCSVLAFMRFTEELGWARFVVPIDFAVTENAWTAGSLALAVLYFVWAKKTTSGNMSKEFGLAAVATFIVLVATGVAWAERLYSAIPGMSFASMIALPQVLLAVSAPIYVYAVVKYGFLDFRGNLDAVQRSLSIAFAVVSILIEGFLSYFVDGFPVVGNLLKVIMVVVILLLWRTTHRAAKGYVEKTLSRPHEDRRILLDQMKDKARNAATVEEALDALNQGLEAHTPGTKRMVLIRDADGHFTLASGDICDCPHPLPSTHRVIMAVKAYESPTMCELLCTTKLRIVAFPMRIREDVFALVLQTELEHAPYSGEVLDDMRKVVTDVGMCLRILLNEKGTAVGSDIDLTEAAPAPAPEAQALLPRAITFHERTGLHKLAKSLPLTRQAFSKKPDEPDEPDERETNGEAS